MGHSNGVICLRYTKLQGSGSGRGFPGGSVLKNPPANAADLGSIPGLGRSPGEENSNLLQYSCLKNRMVGYSPWDHKRVGHNLATKTTVMVVGTLCVCNICTWCLLLLSRLVYDRETGKPKGYGFCEYQDQETALSAMRNLNGREFSGRALRVDNAASEKNKEELKSEYTSKLYITWVSKDVTMKISHSLICFSICWNGYQPFYLTHLVLREVCVCLWEIR